MEQFESLAKRQRYRTRRKLPGARALPDKPVKSGSLPNEDDSSKSRSISVCEVDPHQKQRGRVERRNIVKFRGSFPEAPSKLTNKFSPDWLRETHFPQPSFAAMKFIPSLFSYSSSSSRHRSTSSSDSSRSSESLSKPAKRTIGRNASCLDAEYWTPSPADLPKLALPPAISDLSCAAARNKGGKISKEELELVLSRLGTSDPPTEEELSMIISEDEFAHDDLEEAFRIFDADGDGKISAEELQGFFLTLGDDRCSLEDCRGMIRSVDSRGDGFVCFEDFVRMMTSGQR